MENIERDGTDGLVSQTNSIRYVTFLKEQGLISIFAALFLSIAVYLVLSCTNSQKNKQKKRGIVADTSGEPGLAMRNIKFDYLIREPWPGASTLASLFEQACEKFSERPHLGTRRLISREIIESNNGKKFEKLHLGEYEWENYGEVFSRVCNFASGVVQMGHDLDSRLAIFSDTRAEWLIASQVNLCSFLLFNALHKLCSVQMLF